MFDKQILLYWSRPIRGMHFYKEVFSMKILFALMNSTRWPMAILGYLLMTASFRYFGLNLEAAVLPALAVAAIMCATMVANDYFDRDRDKLVGKSLASDHPKLFLVWMILWWCIALAMTARLFWTNDHLGWLSLILCGLGFSYSWTRSVPFLSTFVVALTTALAASYPPSCCISSDIHFPLIVFFNLIAREIMKDTLDIKGDLNELFGKKTIPLIWGTDAAISVAQGCIVISGVLLLSIMNSSLASATVLGLCISAYQLSAFRIKTSRLIMDITMFLFLGARAFAPKSILMALGKIDLSNGKKEEFVEVRAPRKGVLTWILAYCWFALTIWLLGLLRTPGEALMITMIGLCTLLALSKVPTNKEYGTDNPQTIRVRRMIVGMVLGLIAVVLDRFGIPYIVTATAVPILLTLWNMKSKAVAVLKDQSTILGIIIISFIAIGPAIFVQLAIAYTGVVIFYYIKSIRCGLQAFGLRTI